MAAPTLITVVLGLVVRFALFRSSLNEWLAERVEISTPLTSWKSVTEGVTLLQNGVTPYSGDVFHESPLVLYFFHHVHSLSTRLVPFVFLFLDLLTGYILHSAAAVYMRYQMNKQTSEKSHFAKDVSQLLINKSDVWDVPKLVLSVFLLNPYSIVTCVAQSTQVITNLAIAAAFYFTLKDRRSGAALSIAIATYQSLYPAMMIVPCSMHLAILQARKTKSSPSSPSVQSGHIQTALWFLFWLACLLGLSYLMLGSWQFLESTYGCIFSVPNLQPNMGLFWYFFTEMFEHFRLFFVWVFQINVFIYTVPLAIKLWDHPMFVMFIQCIIISTFKSYPAFGDTIIYLALLPLWSSSFHYLRQSLVVGVMFVVSSVLAPILYHLWIYAGSANANFFFAFTLVYNTAQIFLATDLLYAFLRRNYSLKNGMKQLDEDGKERHVTLQ
ncbi:phosphatidylinositol glycan anchor biosynthesis class U protein-like [Amphiura filiformis]|uniref:phosphatidylinositol glycan anchor biosynthesis class U protein-like n=1 Tax=Amphiura filiformis TaxID=82378 RepID=UPI003B210F8B